MNRTIKNKIKEYKTKIKNLQKASKQTFDEWWEKNITINSQIFNCDETPNRGIDNPELVYTDGKIKVYYEYRYDYYDFWNVNDKQAKMIEEQQEKFENRF